MRKYISLEDADNMCKDRGDYRKIAFVNRQQIKSLLSNAETCINTANLVASSIGKDDPKWMSVYTGHYEALHILAEAFLQFESRKISNHQCLFAYLCKNHSEFSFDWDFFEEVRFNRNGVYYYGQKITYQEWEKVKPKFQQYISALKKEIGEKLSDSP